MTEFHDPELERMLGRASGAYPDANVAFEAVRGQVRRVKRRRAMVASTAACVLLAGMVALAVRGGDEARVLPSHLDDTSSSVESHETTPDTEVPTPDTEMAPATMVIDTSVDPMSTASGSPGGPGPNSGKGTSGSHPSTTTTTAPQVQPVVPAIDVQWFLSKGGSAGVQLVHGRMVLVSTSPAAGFTSHVNEASGDRIRVEFSNGKSTYELQLELSNGTIKSSSQNKGS